MNQPRAAYESAAVSIGESVMDSPDGERLPLCGMGTAFEAFKAVKNSEGSAHAILGWTRLCFLFSLLLPPTASGGAV